MEGRFCCLPEELLTDIFLRLPVKMLLRSASVCRRWHTIIKSKSFIQSHFHREGNVKGHLVYWRGAIFNPESQLRAGDKITYDEVSGCSLFLDGTLERQEVLDLPGTIVTLRGPCNGIFCVFRTDRTLALWNPATRMLLPLPPPPVAFRREIGFGMDPSTHDLKVVLIDEELNQCKFAVYSSSNHSWKLSEAEVLSRPDYYVMGNDFGSPISNGFVYWLTVNRTNHDARILAFDTHNDIFQEIMVPDILKSNWAATLDFYDDTLAVVTYHNMSDFKRIDVWLMKEQGIWTKHPTFYLPFDCFAPIGIWKRNQIFTSRADWKMVIYDIDSGDTTVLEPGRTGTRACTYDFFPRPYTESLVSI